MTATYEASPPCCDEPPNTNAKLADYEEIGRIVRRIHNGYNQAARKAVPGLTEPSSYAVAVSEIQQFLHSDIHLACAERDAAKRKCEQLEAELARERRLVASLKESLASPARSIAEAQMASQARCANIDRVFEKLEGSAQAIYAATNLICAAVAERQQPRASQGPAKPRRRRGLRVRK